MRDKQAPGHNLPSIEDTNQSRTVKLPTKSQMDPPAGGPTPVLSSLPGGRNNSHRGHSGKQGE